MTDRRHPDRPLPRLPGGWLWLCVMLVLATGCEPRGGSRVDAGDPFPAVLVEVEPVRRERYTGRYYLVSGPCLPRKVYQCGFELGGKVTAVSVDEGDTVGPDETLASLDLEYFDKQVEQARIEFEQAEADFNRIGRAGADIFPQADVDRARRLRDAARLAHDIARDELAKATCHAPPGVVRGTVDHVGIDSGEVVMPGQAVFTIVDATEVRLIVRVPGAIAAMIDAGRTRADVRIDDVPGTVCVYPAGHESGRALITRVPAMAGTAHQFEIEITIANADGRIRPGMLGRARIALPPTEEMTVLPAAAAVREDDEYVVWLADNDRAVRWAFPAGGTELWGDELLTPAVAPHPRLIVEGFQELIENTRIRQE